METTEAHDIDTTKFSQWKNGNLFTEIVLQVFLEILKVLVYDEEVARRV